MSLEIFDLGGLDILDGTLRNVTAIDATTEATIEAAIDTLANLTSVGTLTTGTWNASVITPVYGGTGIANNVASTITVTGAYALTLTLSAATSVTLPTTGTLATRTPTGSPS